MTVFVLVFWLGGSQAVIDNIATQEECQHLLAAIKEQRPQVAGQCFSVKKAK